MSDTQDWVSFDDVIAVEIQAKSTVEWRNCQSISYRYGRTTWESRDSEGQTTIEAGITAYIIAGFGKTGEYKLTPEY